jgi:hypothetical protein
MTTVEEGRAKGNIERENIVSKKDNVTCRKKGKSKYQTLHQHSPKSGKPQVVRC